MLCIRLFLLLLPSLLSAKTSTREPIHFHIVIASYNNETLVEKNLASVFFQSYQHWSLSYINDASTDETGKRAEQAISKSRWQKRCSITHNATNQGSLKNLYTAISSRPKKEVIVILDGDDQLAHRHVLKRVAQEYTKHHAWLTYGSYVGIPGHYTGICRLIPKKIIRKNAFRKYPWVTSHLRTFYAGLFQRIRKKDLLYQGKFFSSGGDLIIMFPMLEMASSGHIRYIPDILYLYNSQNPLNDFKIHSEGQRIANEWVRAQRPYRPLRSLFSNSK